MTALEQDRPDPRPFLRSIWRRRWLLAGIVTLIPVAIYVVSALLPETYESTAILQARSGTPETSVFSGEFAVSPASADAAVRLVETTTVATRAAEELGEPPSEAGALLDDVDAAPESDDDSAGTPQLFSITASAGDAARAADVANAFATAVADVRTRQGVEAINETIDSLRSQPASAGGRVAERKLAKQLQELEALRASQAASTQILEPATPRSDPESPKPLRNAALALVFSTLLAATLVPVLDRLDRRIHELDELEGLVGARLLAAIPEPAFELHGPSPVVREAFHTLRSSLTYFNVDRSLASVLVTSPGTGDGKTTVATNLAVALARSDVDVVLVDADLRRHPIASRLGGTGRHGLASVLLGEHDLEDAVEVVDADGASLQVLSGGPTVPDPSVLLGSRRMRSVLQELEDESDVVVIDTPAILEVSDALPLVAQVSGVVLVARLDHTERDALWRASRVIASAHGSVLGVVATGVGPTPAYGYSSDGAVSRRTESAEAPRG